eukprot:gene4657-3356_t
MACRTGTTLRNLAPVMGLQVVFIVMYGSIENSGSGTAPESLFVQDVIVLNHARIINPSEVRQGRHVAKGELAHTRWARRAIVTSRPAAETRAGHLNINKAYETKINDGQHSSIGTRTLRYNCTLVVARVSAGGVCW